MYLKTPKRYTSRGRRRRLFGRWWWLYLITPVAVIFAALLWQFREPVSGWFWGQIERVADSVNDQMATNQAPTATPTQSPEIYLTAAESAYNQGAMDEAINNYRLAAAAMPNDPAVHYRLTHLLVTNELYDEALEAAERAINADPYDPRGWAVQGMAYNWTGDNDHAVASLLRALELDPNFAPAQAFLAETYWDLNLTEPAFELINQAVVTAPDDFNVQRSYGYIFQYLEPDAAQEAFERAVQLAPMHGYIAENLADLLFREGNADTGVELLQQVVERNPQDAAAHYRLGRALFNYLGQVEQAREEFERCTVLDEDYIPCLTFLGALQIQEGEFNLCARSYQRAIDAGSTDPIDHYWAGVCYGAIGDCTTAVEVLFDGLELAEDREDEEDIRDALASCQVVITLEPLPTSEFAATPGLDDTLLDEAAAATPEPQ